MLDKIEKFIKSNQYEFPILEINSENENEINLSCLKDISQLKNLWLEINKAIYIKDFYKLGFLQEITIINANELITLPNLPKNLTKIDFNWCVKLTNISCLSKLKQLKILQLYRLENLKELPRLPKSIEKLSLDRCIRLTDISSLNTLSNLKELILIRLDNLNSLFELPKNLTKLTVWQCEHVEHFSHITELSNLQNLELVALIKLIKLPDLPRSLRKLEIKRCVKLNEANFKNLINLETLVLWDLYALKARFYNYTSFKKEDIKLCDRPYLIQEEAS